MEVSWRSGIDPDYAPNEGDTEHVPKSVRMVVRKAHCERGVGRCSLCQFWKWSEWRRLGCVVLVSAGAAGAACCFSTATRAGPTPSVSTAESEATWGGSAGTSQQPRRGLWGEYGFLTDFNVDEESARQRVRQMVKIFHIREFQFYDAVEGYSHPPGADVSRWNGSLGKVVRRNAVAAYVDEIRRLGGRAWLYVQAQGSDPGDSAWEQGFKVVGQHKVDGQPLLDIVEFNAAWAERVAPQWGEFAAPFGFAGIHWDMIRAAGDFPGFLRRAQGHLKARGLLQTSNSVNGYLWQDSLLSDGIVAFPYWEVWRWSVEERFFSQVKRWGGGVFVCYPGKSKEHPHEVQNRAMSGTCPFDLLIMRWKKARRYGATYLAIGDGLRHVQTCYFPDTAEMSPSDVEKLRHNVFGEGMIRLRG